MQKKYISTFVLAAVLGFASPAHASWQTDLNTAITTGNTAQINQIIAANPDSQGQIALTLMGAAKSQLTTNPTEAAKLYQAAAPLAAEIPAASAKQAADYVSVFVAAAKTPSFQSANTDAAASLFSTSLTIASQPTIAAASPTLYSETLVASDDFLRKYPKLADGALQSQVLLAQQQVTPPNNLSGPQTPQENQDLGTNDETIVTAPPASTL